MARRAREVLTDEQLARLAENMRDRARRLVAFYRQLEAAGVPPTDPLMAGIARACDGEGSLAKVIDDLAGVQLRRTAIDPWKKSGLRAVLKPGFEGRRE